MYLLCLILLGALSGAAAEQILFKLTAGQITPINHEFALKHIFHHGVGPVSYIHRRVDIPTDGSLQVLYKTDRISTWKRQQESFSAISQPVEIHRLSHRSPSTIEPLLDSAFQSHSLAPYSLSEWEVNEIHGPKIDDKETIISLVKMAAAAYAAPSINANEDMSTWDHVTPSTSPNNGIPIGWETIGLRGQVFVSKTADIVIIALKGTSPPYYPGPKETTDLDRENDNLLFSCCCGDSKYFYSPICSCSCNSNIPPTTSSAIPHNTDSPKTVPIIPKLEAHSKQCNATCQKENLKSPDRYWSAAREIYTNISLLYPTSQIWLTGHSLGGAMASLLGTAYGLPVVTFEAPGEAAAAKRLSLPVAPLLSPKSRFPTANYRTELGHVREERNKLSQIYHFGHTADPIYTGDCHSFWSSCQISGYFFETRCHTGYECTYDTVGDLNWLNWIGNHRLSVVSSVLEQYGEVAGCMPVDERCTDCGAWDFED